MHIDSTNKRRYIQLAYKILKQEGVSGLTVRRLANELGCTPAVLYRHFDNLNHLIALASVPFIVPYYHAYDSFLEMRNAGEIDNLTWQMLNWRAFVHESFKYYPYYDALFFSGEQNEAETLIFEHYQLFPEIYKKSAPAARDTLIVFNGSLEDREYLGLRPSIAEKRITQENALLLSKLSCATARGIFALHKVDHDEPGVAAQAEEESMMLIIELYQRYFKDAGSCRASIEKALSIDLSDMDDYVSPSESMDI